MSEDKISENEKRLEDTRNFWNNAAATFDNEPDHGLQDPLIRAAWMTLLSTSLPPAQSVILDIGCGTGTLSILLDNLGYQVTGIDISPGMIAVAQQKATSTQHPIQFHVMDAGFPQFPSQQFDALVCRHLLWTLPEPAQVLQRWVKLVRPGGSFLLIER